MDNIENKLLELKDDNNKVPEVVLNKVNEAFNEIRNDKSKDSNSKKIFPKKYFAVAAGIILITTIGFGKPAIGAMKSFIFNFGNKSIESAVNNNYVQSITDKKVSTEKFNLELKNVLVDQSNIALDFNLDIKDNSMTKWEEIENNDITMNIAFLNEDGSVNNNIKENISTTSYEIDKSNLSNNKLGIKVLFHSSTNEFQKMKNLNVKISNITFLKLKTDVISTTDFDFNVKLDLNDKLSNPTTINYKSSSGLKNIIINKATLNPTGLFVDLNYKGIGYDENIVIHTNLVDTKGNKYKMEEASLGTTIEGYYHVSGSFKGVSSFDNIDTFILEIENPDGTTIDRIKLTK
ncbi:MAG: hypothetical protein RSF37_05540 [Clostridium sp.]|uniref:hypothetical protein n=1 Tax=Clostridium sp. TaxID=1506 RepID=UPI002FC62942